jgi:hypothetical protein
MNAYIRLALLLWQQQRVIVHTGNNLWPFMHCASFRFAGDDLFVPET